MPLMERGVARVRQDLIDPAARHDVAAQEQAQVVRPRLVGTAFTARRG
jgi:hypothetical protein